MEMFFFYFLFEMSIYLRKILFTIPIWRGVVLVSLDSLNIRLKDEPIECSGFQDIYPYYEQRRPLSLVRMTPL